MATVLRKGYRGLSLLVQLNSDRILIAFSLGAALFVAAYICSL